MCERTAVLSTPDGRGVLELFEYIHPPANPMPPTQPNDLGTHRVAFQVDDLDAALAKAERRSIKRALGERLRLLIQRIETLEAEKKNISDDIKDVYIEAKSAGFDTKAMKRIISLRKKEKAERDAEEAMVELYKDALGL